MAMKTLRVREEFTTLDIGQRIKTLRRDKGYSLNDLARITGISEATLSRVENNQTLVSAHNLYVLARIFDVDVTAFFESNARPISAGIRSICRKNEGVMVDQDLGRARLLCSDLSNKKMHPMMISISRKTLDPETDFSRYRGEEYIFVIEGKVTLLSEFYEPLCLEKGDSVYFDSNMAHGYISTDGNTAQILRISTANSQNLLNEKTEKPKR